MAVRVVKWLASQVFDAAANSRGGAEEGEEDEVVLQCGRRVLDHMPSSMRTELWLSRLHHGAALGAAAAARYQAVLAQVGRRGFACVRCSCTLQLQLGAPRRVRPAAGRARARPPLPGCWGLMQRSERRRLYCSHHTCSNACQPFSCREGSTRRWRLKLTRTRIALFQGTRGVHHASLKKASPRTCLLLAAATHAHTAAGCVGRAGALAPCLATTRFTCCTCSDSTS